MKSSFLVVLSLAVLASTSCGFEGDRRPEADAREAASAPQATLGAQEEPDLPKLTGDRARDKAALLDALKRTHAAWKEADHAWHEALKSKKPDTALVRHLEERSASLKKRATAIQALLDRVRECQRPEKAAAAVSGLPQLTGDLAKDKVLLLKALEKARAGLEAARAEYEGYLGSGKKPDAAVVARLEKKSSELHRRAVALQKMLDQLDK